MKLKKKKLLHSSEAGTPAMAFPVTDVHRPVYSQLFYQLVFSEPCCKVIQCSTAPAISEQSKYQNLFSKNI